MSAMKLTKGTQAMDMLKPLMRRASKFPAMDVVKASGLSKALIYDLIAGRRKGVNLDSYAKIEKAVTRLEAAAAKKAAKTKSSKKADSAKIQKRHGVAGKRS